jgi:GrpB-like predicted nucleotidyltransferase (UPF0157 family)
MARADPLHDMLQPIPVILTAHNLEWPRTAATYAKRLRVLGSNLVAVHHIGSTSVPGLIAKPIIDLIPVVNSLTRLDEQRHHVEALGYQWHGEFGISGRRYCTLTNESGARVVQLHFFKTDSPHVERHIAFRDYLRAHPEEANAYAIEKRRAQNLHPANSHAYADEKDKWIRAAETKALIWASRQKSNHDIT